VKESRIHGKGVFVNGGFREGEVVLEIDDSHVVTEPSTLSDEDRQLLDSDWCDYLANGKTVLMQVPERYINHSCDPNTYVKTINGVRKVLAMRDIEEGEEITYDYAVNGYYGEPAACHCGSSNCKGVLLSDFFRLPRPLQMKYIPYLDAWFVEQFRDRIEKLKRGC